MDPCLFRSGNGVERACSRCEYFDVMDSNPIEGHIHKELVLLN